MQIKIVSKIFNMIKVAYHFYYNYKTRKKKIYFVFNRYQFSSSMIDPGNSGKKIYKFKLQTVINTRQ